MESLPNVLPQLKHLSVGCRCLWWKAADKRLKTELLLTKRLNGRVKGPERGLSCEDLKRAWAVLLDCIFQPQSLERALRSVERSFFSSSESSASFSESYSSTAIQPAGLLSPNKWPCFVCSTAPLGFSNYLFITATRLPSKSTEQAMWTSCKRPELNCNPGYPLKLYWCIFTLCASKLQHQQNHKYFWISSRSIVPIFSFDLKMAVYYSYVRVTSYIKVITE